MSAPILTPLMRQYHDIKQRINDALLFFQVGDFYELFFDDAKTAAAFLGITLTKRGNLNGEPIPLCGVPVHTKDHYIAKLVRGGFKVALCEQLTEPIPGKVVERGITQVYTPGTLIDPKLLDAKSASYLFSFFPLMDSWGLLFAELLTAQLYATLVPANAPRMLEAELSRFFPDEVLLPANKVAKQYEPQFKKWGYFTTVLDYSYDQSQDRELHQWLEHQFDANVATRIDTYEPLKLACFNFYRYIKTTQVNALTTFKQLHFYKPEDYLMLDAATQRNLELTQGSSGQTAHTLFATLDGARTPMGSRMIKKWMVRPLIKAAAIEQRYDVLSDFISNVALLESVQQLLNGIGDIERVVGRIALRKAQLADFLSLMQALHLTAGLQPMLAGHEVALLVSITSHLGDFSTLHELLRSSLNEDSTTDWLIKTGFDAELDRMRTLVEQSNTKIVALEAEECQATGIASLKIRYNQIHGYYIEVTKANMHLVPAHFIRQQTLVGRERFITPALQQLQAEINKARSEITAVEKEVFERVKLAVYNQVNALRKWAQALAHLDALLGLARVSYEHNYVRPTFNTQRAITITQGRHPVIERVVQTGFIANDTQLDDEQSTWIITGPNMGGKSTYLRQVAHICLMAQMGCFVPARAACLPLVDRIFTRIGAGDNLAQGKSTFLVEMEETATICLYATANSLVILDEVGRGTSTFDGLAIAQAVVEYIHTQIKARCLFATHYHELTALQAQFPGLVSYYAASSKTQEGILFLYKMIKGVADGSFGVEVAKLAQLPESIITRAHDLLMTFNAQDSLTCVKAAAPDARISQLVKANEQLAQQVQRIEQALLRVKRRSALLEDIDYENLSPKQAFDLLWRLKEHS